MRAAAVVIMVLFVSAPSWAQQQPNAQEVPNRQQWKIDPEGQCSSIAKDRSDLAPLEKACEDAVKAWETLPNFVCDMKMTRHEPGKKPEKISAQLRFYEGEEELSDLTINGQKADVTPDSGVWTRGEFSPAGLTVLDGRSSPRFTPRGEQKTPVGSVELVFDYQIDKKNNQSWTWNIPPYRYKPGFHGTLRIDKQSGQLRFVSLVADDIDPYVPTLSASVKTDYAPVRIGELGEYLLPAHSEVRSCYRFTPGCSEISRDFENCRKFAAKARIVE